MKITKYLFGLGLVAAMGLTSCSSDEPTVNVPSNDGNEAFFATVSLSLPTNAGSRSATVDPGTGTGSSNSEHGTIDGEDYENQIKSILVILATIDDGQYTLRTVNQGDANLNGAMTATPTYTIKFNNNDVAKLAGQNVYPFVVCNPDAQMIQRFKNMPAGNTSFVDDIMSLTDANNFSGWLNNNFLMTNAYINETETAVLMPDKNALNGYNSSDKPFNLTQANGPIKVERTVARFDFKSKQLTGLDVNTYEIKTDATTDPATVGHVTLTGMALINEAQDFYTFRRVSADGTDNKWIIGGLETTKNYMVSPNFSDLGQRRFMLPGFDANGALAPANMTYTDLSGMGTTDYSIWRYATENAIPGTDNQIKNYTTGVIFKGHITFADTNLAAIAAKGQPIYKFGKTIYGGYDELVAEIESNPNTLLAYNALQAGFYTGFDADGKLTGKVDESQINNGGADLSKHGFTVYRADTDGKYNVYYYYWNRHNDNGNPNVMGNMEFGVVRNNVYRLTVNNIYNFGHPGDPSDDPDPEDPNDPDESVDLYISLDVQVLPWTVRYNEIEF